MSLAMSPDERERFLAGVHVGVLAIADGARGPWLLPIWYGYEPGGDVRIVTFRESRKTRLLRAAGRASFCVQTEDPPYRYVTVEGPVVEVVDPVTAEERRSMAERYLGAERAGAYLRATAEMAEQEVVVVIRPERWLSADYSRQGGD